MIMMIDNGIESQLTILFTESTLLNQSSILFTKSHWIKVLYYYVPGKAREGSGSYSC